MHARTLLKTATLLTFLQPSCFLQARGLPRLLPEGKEAGKMAASGCRIVCEGVGVELVNGDILADGVVDGATVQTPANQGPRSSIQSPRANQKIWTQAHYPER
jgi:hypothetical protein